MADTDRFTELREPIRNMPTSESPNTAPGPDLERAAWRVARAGRARLLVDASNYYGALREALKRARRRILIVGWDIDSRTPLAADPSDTGDDLPLELGPFLAALAERRPGIEIRLLLWDYAMLYALEREPLPRVQLDWTSPPQIALCLDGSLPVAASHHQKLAIVDDAMAFCGGLDLTIRRWDTPAHDPDDDRRVDPKGQSYPPFHDAQMVVDGEAAAALAEIARERWAAAGNAPLEPAPADGDPWPADLTPDLREVGVAIARTRPRYGGAAEVREGEATLRAAIAEAERLVYIENQYLTADALGDALIERMLARPALEVLAVVPGEHDGWLEKAAMQAGRVRLMARFRAAGLGDRVRLVTPVVDGEAGPVGVMVHAKIVVVDDRSLRIGSSNLNNRSMGLDTECDVVVLGRDDDSRRSIRRLRDSLIAEHTGRSVDEVAEALDGSGSVLGAFERLSGAGRRGLRPVADDPTLGEAVPEPVAALADPDRPIPELISLEALRPPRSARRWLKRWPVAAVALVAFVLVLAWRYSPLGEWAEVEHLAAPMRAVAASGWAPLAVLGIYLAAGLTMFPITVLIGVTAMVFGPWEGVLYSGVGSIAGALVGYALGRFMGDRAPVPWRSRDGRLARLIRTFADNGVIGMASLRMLPVAPFTLINLAAGVVRIRFVDFALGSTLGLAPGIVAFNLMGVQFAAVLTEGRPEDVGLLVGLLLAWVLVSVLLQRVINRRLGTPGGRAG